MQFREEDSARGAPAREGRLLPVADVAELLRRDADAVARALLGEPNRHVSSKRELRWGNKGSLRVHIAGPRKGRWVDEGSGERGDMLNLAERERGGKEAGLAWARDWVGGRPGVTLARPAVREAERKADDAEAEAKARKNRAIAQRLYDEAQPFVAAHAETYLRARGIIRLPAGHPLRWHPDVAVPDQGGKKYPLMVAPFTGPDGTFYAVHRTFLARDGVPEKAPFKRNKMALGAPECGGIWLTPAGAHDRVLVGEGIETVLSAWQARPDWGCVAAYSAGQLTKLALPSNVREVVILADVDEPDQKTGKRPGEDAARKAAQRFAEQGYAVWIAWPGPRDGAKCDFNDLLQAGGVEAVGAALDAAERVTPPGSVALAEHVAKLQAEARKVAGKLPRGVRCAPPGTEPLPPLNALPLREAQRRARMVIYTHANAVVRWAAWAGLEMRAAIWARLDLARERPDLAEAMKPAADTPADDPKREEAEAWLSARQGALRAEWDARLRAARWEPVDEPPATLVLKVTVGVGKTHLAMEALAKAIKAAPVPMRAVWLVPTHKLAEEAATRFAGEGVETRTLRGRSQLHADGAPLCPNHELAGRLACYRISGRRVCAPDICPGCRYWAQADDFRERGVLIATHEALRTGKLPAGIGLAGMPIIVDEGPMKALRHPHVHEDGKPRWVTLTGPSGGGRDASLRDIAKLEDAPDDLGRVMRGIIALLEMLDLGAQGWRDVLEDAGVTRDALAGVIAWADGKTKHSLMGMRGNAGAIEMALHGGLHRPGLRDALAVMNAVARDWDVPERARLQSLDVRGVGEGRQVLPLLPSARIPRGALVLDASADPMIYAALGVPRDRVVSVLAKERLRIVQVTSHGFSHTALGLGADEPEETRQSLMARNLLRAVVRGHGVGKAGATVPKKLRARWTGEEDPKGFTLWEAEGAWIGHYGALRGSNDMEGCTAIVMAGRIMPTREDVEREARALFAGDPEPLAGLLPPATGDDPGGSRDWERRWVPLRMRDGRMLEMEQAVHADPRVNALLVQKCDEEIVQGVGRIRGAQVKDGEPAKTVYILASRATGLPVDDVLSYDDALALLAVGNALRSGDGITVLDVEGLREHAPVLVSRPDGSPLAETEAKGCAAKAVRAIVSQSVAFIPGDGIGRKPLEDREPLRETDLFPGVARICLKSDLSGPKPAKNVAYSGWIEEACEAIRAIIGPRAGPMIEVALSDADAWRGGDHDRFVAILEAAREAQRRGEPLGADLIAAQTAWLETVHPRHRLLLEAMDPDERNEAMAVSMIIRTALIHEQAKGSCDRLDAYAVQGDDGQWRWTDNHSPDGEADRRGLRSYVTWQRVAAATGGQTPVMLAEIFDRPAMQCFLQEAGLAGVFERVEATPELPGDHLLAQAGRAAAQGVAAARRERDLRGH